MNPVAVTLKQIADEAGVSITTVANVIKGKSVSESKRKKIQKLLDKYDYSPNMNAKSLVNSSSNLIGVLYYVSEGEDHDNFSDPFISELLSGIEKEARNHGNFVLVHSFTDINDIKILQNNWLFDGFIVATTPNKLVHPISSIIRDSIRSVFIDVVLDDEERRIFEQKQETYFIMNDDYLAAKEVTEHMISKGHERIAFLASRFVENEESLTEVRYAGACSAVHQHFGPNKTIGKVSMDNRSSLLADESEYTAVVCASDKIAAEFLELYNSGAIKGPGMSVAGFDNAVFDTYLTPQLTTVDLHHREKGKLAVQLINEKTKGTDMKNNFHMIKHELIERNSVFERGV